MDWLKLLQEIFTVCIIPLLGILTKYLITYIDTKKNIAINQNINEIQKKYITLLAETIKTCVIATNQTYVDALKEKDAFTPEAQKEAFNKTLNAVLAILGEEGQKYLTEVYGDLNEYIINQIQAEVKANKLVKDETKKEEPVG